MLDLVYLAEPEGKAPFSGRALFRIEGDCLGSSHWFDSNGASYPLPARGSGS